MKFRMVYFGPVRPDKSGMDINKNKQSIRSVFNRQLKEFWDRTQALSDMMIEPSIYSSVLSNGDIDLTSSFTRHLSHSERITKIPLVKAIQCTYSTQCMNKNGYAWVPLVLKSYRVQVELDILMMFADGRPGPTTHGDIDNRVSTIIDALQQPKAGSIIGAPRDNETPFFVLMEDDSMVSKLAVEVDTLYRRPRSMSQKNAKDRFIHATVTVTLRPYHVTTWNLMFA